MSDCAVNGKCAAVSVANKAGCPIFAVLSVWTLLCRIKVTAVHKT